MKVSTALVVPGEMPPGETSLKRALLFFDEVHVPGISEQAIINAKEVAEVFPNGRSIQWGELCPYPRSTSYDEAHRLLQSSLHRAVSTGKLKFLDPAHPSPDDAVKTWVAAVATLKSKDLLRAALPDFSAEQEPVNLKSASFYNMVVVGLTDYPSKYLWLTEVDASPAISISESWRRVALGRLGQVIKATRYASHAGAIPLADDPINQNIFLALGAQAFGELPSPEALAQSAIVLDSVKPENLDAALEASSWAEVFKMRKELLPATKRLRHELRRAVRATAAPQNSNVETYRKQLEQIKGSYRRIEDGRAAAWRKIGFRLVESAALSGLAVLPTNPAWATAITSMAVATVVKTLAGSVEPFRTVMLARNARAASPFFAFDNIEKVGQLAAKRSKLPDE